jgi:hypothetical protein
MVMNLKFGGYGSAEMASFVVIWRWVGGAWRIDGFWIVCLDLLTPYTQSSELQAIQRYQQSTDFTVHRYTCNRFLSLH